MCHCGIFVHRVKPSIDTSFAGIDFLSAANEADDHCPIFVAIHARNQKFWFRHCKPGAILLSTHKAGCLPQIPCALCLVKNDDMLRWRIRIGQRFVSEMMYVLNERLNTFANFPLSHFLALGLLATDLVTRKRLPQDSN